MLVTFLRTLLLYLVVVFGIRLMGKRQIGELQPSELVITILISNIATLTIEETDSPMFAGLLPIQLRQNSIFRVEEVEFAVVETNGKLSIYQKYQNRSVTPQVLSLPDCPEENAPPLAVVCDGTVMHEALRRCGKDLRWVEKKAAAKKLAIRDIYLMVACPDGTCDIVEKERS